MHNNSLSNKIYLFGLYFFVTTFFYFSGPKHFNRGGHNYFFSKDEPGFEDLKGDWLEGRNFCREYCMDLVSLETQDENNFFKNFLKRSK